MSQAIFTGDLPRLTSTAPFNLFDQVLGLIGSPVGPTRSSGAQLVTRVPETPQLPSDIDILGYSFLFQGVIRNIQTIVNGAITPVFATLGRLYGGLLLNSGYPEGNGPYAGPPKDATMVDLLWDGTTDPPWPQATSVPPPQAATFQSYKQNLSQPVHFGSDDTLDVGLWLAPMLGQNVGIWIMNASYSILYDNPNR